MLKLIGHKKDVRSVAFAPDGRLVSGGDRTVRVWDARSGACLDTFKVGQVVYAVAVAPDGKSFAYGGRTAEGLTANRVTECAFDGAVLARYEAPTFATVRHWADGALTTQQVPTGYSIWNVGYSSDGARLAAALRRPGGGNFPDGAGAFEWAHTGGAATALSPDAYALAYAPAGRGIAVAGAQQVLFRIDPTASVCASLEATALFDNPTHTQRGPTYRSTARWPGAVAFVPGADIAVVAANSFLEFVSPVRLDKVKRMKSGCRSVVALAVSPNGRVLLAGGRMPGAVEVYDVVARALRKSFDFGIGGVHALAFAPDGLTFAAAGDDGLVLCDAPE